MENGADAPPFGSHDRGNAATRNDPNSAPSLQRDAHSSDISSSTEAMRFPWSATTPSTAEPLNSGNQTSTSVRPPIHKRASSGSILSRLNFMRGPADDGTEASKDGEFGSQRDMSNIKSRKSIDDDEPVVSPTSPNGESAMASALKTTKTRKRKGSLRKTALLGGRRIVPEARERRSSFLQRSPSTKQSSNQPGDSLGIPVATPRSELNPLAISTDRQEHSASRTQSRHESRSYEQNDVWPDTKATSPGRLSLVTGQDSQGKGSRASNNTNDVKSPSSAASYTSTDDDEALTFGRPSALQKPLSSAATAFFQNPSETSLPLRSHSSGTSLSKPHTHSPLAHTISSTASSLYQPDLDSGHDYTETEYWGWVILFVTWLTFTVGMGSCLELWSWAWDVGETPYAPPELEDDPTLPIVGYYPALIVLTGVVAWVWITVAWVGMKYFRHAKIEV